MKITVSRAPWFGRWDLVLRFDHQGRMWSRWVTFYVSLLPVSRVAGEWKWVWIFGRKGNWFHLGPVGLEVSR